VLDQIFKQMDNHDETKRREGVDEAFANEMKRQRALEKRAEQLRQEREEFRQKVIRDLTALKANADQNEFVFPHMEKENRVEIHDLAGEIGGLETRSYGEEGVDRYVVVYKAGFAPPEDEGSKEVSDRPAAAISAAVSSEPFVPRKGNYLDRKAALTSFDQGVYSLAENRRDLRSVEEIQRDIAVTKQQQQPQYPQYQPQAASDQDWY